MPGFVARLDMASSCHLPLKLLILTATRTNEIAGAEWCEFDMNAKLWTIPASRVKAGADHDVPLTGEMLEVLDAVPRDTGRQGLFPQCRPHTMLDALKAIDDCEKYTVHGFRSSFRDWAGNETNFPVKWSRKLTAMMSETMSSALTDGARDWPNAVRSLKHGAAMLSVKGLCQLHVGLRERKETSFQRKRSSSCSSLTIPPPAHRRSIEGRILGQRDMQGCCFSAGRGPHRSTLEETVRKSRRKHPVLDGPQRTSALAAVFARPCAWRPLARLAGGAHGAITP